MSDPYASIGKAADPYAHIAAPPATPHKRSTVEDVTGFMANLNRGLGIGDEMAAGFNTAKDVVTGKARLQDVPQAFDANMKHQRQIEDSYTAAHPHVAALARGTGNALTMAAPVGPGAQAFATGGRTINALRGGTVAALTGAGYAAVDRGSPAERLRAASKAATDPVTIALGGTVGAIAGGRPKPTPQPAPSLEELTAQKNAAYQAVDNSGVKYTPEAFRGLTQDMGRTLDENGFHAGLHPKTAAMMDKLGQSSRATPDYAPTLTQLDQLRQQIGRDLASSPDAGERRMGQILRDQIDQFIANTGPEHLTGGDPATASDLITTARDLNTRVAKLRTLDNLDEAASDRAAATGSGGNIGNATRQNVIRFKNRVGNLTPDEQAAAQQVIDGTPVGNALRQVGKLSPQGNGLMLAGHIAAAVPSGGTSGAVALTGALSKAASDAITARNVQALRELIASGGDAAAEVSRQLAADPQYADLRATLANDLAVQAGVQGSSARAPAQAAANQ